jgi:hypothetical protein
LHREQIGRPKRTPQHDRVRYQADGILCVASHAALRGPYQRRIVRSLVQARPFGPPAYRPQQTIVFSDSRSSQTHELGCIMVDKDAVVRSLLLTHRTSRLSLVCAPPRRARHKTRASSGLESFCTPPLLFHLISAYAVLCVRLASSIVLM